jgi:hypothetical protein
MGPPLVKPPAARKLVQRSFRIFEDQLEALRFIAHAKYRDLRNVSDLVREALQELIDQAQK